LITASFFDKTVFKVDFRCLNKIDKLIKLHKDHTISQQKNNIVYKINCQDCNASYIGQTVKKTAKNTN